MHTEVGTNTFRSYNLLKDKQDSVVINIVLFHKVPKQCWLSNTLCVFLSARKEVITERMFIISRHQLFCIQNRYSEIQCQFRSISKKKTFQNRFTNIHCKQLLSNSILFKYIQCSTNKPAALFFCSKSPYKKSERLSTSKPAFLRSLSKSALTAWAFSSVKNRHTIYQRHVSKWL